MKPVAKVRAAGTSRRRRIDFTLEDSRNTDRFGIAETQEYMSKYSSLLSNAVGKSTVKQLIYILYSSAISSYSTRVRGITVKYP